MSHNISNIIEHIVKKDFYKAKLAIHEVMNEKLGMLLEEKLLDYAPTIMEEDDTIQSRQSVVNPRDKIEQGVERMRNISRSQVSNPNTAQTGRNVGDASRSIGRGIKTGVNVASAIGGGISTAANVVTTGFSRGASMVGDAATAVVNKVGSEVSDAVSGAAGYVSDYIGGEIDSFSQGYTEEEDDQKTRDILTNNAAEDAKAAKQRADFDASDAGKRYAAKGILSMTGLGGLVNAAESDLETRRVESEKTSANQAKASGLNSTSSNSTQGMNTKNFVELNGPEKPSALSATPSATAPTSTPTSTPAPPAPPEDQEADQASIDAERGSARDALIASNKADEARVASAATARTNKKISQGDSYKTN